MEQTDMSSISILEDQRREEHLREFKRLTKLIDNPELVHRVLLAVLANSEISSSGGPEHEHTVAERGLGYE
jgi:hypothetical protein